MRLPAAMRSEELARLDLLNQSLMKMVPLTMLYTDDATRKF
jgi:hypothetical protein